MLATVSRTATHKKNGCLFSVSLCLAVAASDSPPLPRLPQPSPNGRCIIAVRSRQRRVLVIVCCFPPLHPSVACFRLMTLRRGAGSGTSIIFYINDIFITAVVWNALPERSVSPEERSRGTPRAEESPRSNLPGIRVLVFN